MVWPEHWHAITVLCWMSTQWRVQVGYAGVLWVGLDYTALPFVLSTCLEEVPEALRQPQGELMWQVRTLENAAVKARNEG